MIPSNFRGIVMIGTAESQTSLHALVHTLHIFQEVYHIQSPNKDARKEVSRQLPASYLLIGQNSPDIDKFGGTAMRKISRRYHGPRRSSKFRYDFDTHGRLFSC